MHKVLAVASAGGHWQQLMLLRPAFAHHDTRYVATLEGLAQPFGLDAVSVVSDCNRNTPLRLLRCTLGLLALLRAHRPDVVISTGAMPGVIALALGRLRGARTIWVDSAANAEEMSSSGRLARRVADLWLSQWPEAAEAAGADYAGRLL